MTSDEKPLIIPFPGNEALAYSIATQMDLELGTLHLHRFPDGEHYVRYETSVNERNVILVCSLDHADEKLLPVIFAAHAAKDLGARQLGLVAPYLGYMRQDRRFRPGEAITSAAFARTLDLWIDWLLTVDPHLHRRTSLTEIYSVPSILVHSAPKIADYIRTNIHDPIVVGPDSESQQWISEVARAAGVPCLVLEKARHDDREVEVIAPDMKRWRDRTPVLVDDIISTARTMIAAADQLSVAGMKEPICIGVHGIFAETAYDDLISRGVEEVVTCNTIPHTTNRIDVSGLIVDGLRKLVKP